MNGGGESWQLLNRCAAIHAPTIMTNNHSTAIVQRLWNYCNVLGDDGVSFGDCYVYL